MRAGYCGEKGGIARAPKGLFFFNKALERGRVAV